MDGAGMNFYAVLGIPQDADDESIRSAYRILARRYHPDRGAGSSAEKFRKVNEAYQTLIDPASRRSHDLSLVWAETQAPRRIEPMVAPSGPFRVEDARVFGRSSSRFDRPFSAPPVRPGISFDELLGRWLLDALLRF
jgi:curved DNA-binding protein CbpA